jgi:hypothetical protein
MSNLLYSSETDQLVTRQDMRAIPVPPPMGPRHHPYSFADFADNTVSAIEGAGYSVTGEEFAVQKDGMRVFGILKVSNSPDLGVSPAVPALASSENVPALYKPKWNLVVGVRGSNDQSISRGLVLGTRVMVCSNLCFSGDLGDWSKKQTTNVEANMPDIIRRAVDQLDRKNEELTVNFDSFNAAQVDRDGGDRILMDILRGGGFSASQFERAVDHWDKLPADLEEHSANGRTLWWLFNACTHGLKPTGRNSNHNDKAHQSAIIYNKLVTAVAARPRLLN